MNCKICFHLLSKPLPVLFCPFLPALKYPWFHFKIVFYVWECIQLSWESRHRRGQSKKDETNKNVTTARMVTAQDFPTLGLPSLLLQFDPFLLRAMHKVDQQYLLIFCGSAKKGVGQLSSFACSSYQWKLLVRWNSNWSIFRGSAV